MPGVEVFNTNHVLINVLATTGSPSALSFDLKQKNLYVTDTKNARVRIYSYPSGTLEADGQLGSPSNIAVPYNIQPAK